MKKNYNKPQIKSDSVLEQTSLACAMSQELQIAGDCAEFVKDNMFFDDCLNHFGFGVEGCTTTVLS